MGTLARVAGGVVAGLVSFSALSSSVTVARDFNSALAETSTLIQGSASELQFLEDSARSMSREFGGSATAQVQAFYQAISAGAGTVENAAMVLDTANRLAIGGVTDVGTAVDALTTAMNAYSAEGLTAAEVSDALFVGIKAGKTTAGELASALGQIVPIASSVGVSFDEVVAGISALTTQGQSTSQATTGLRQVLASIIKPTQQAAETADALGIAFNTQALQAQGLSGFLQEVVQKTGGSQEAMANLFGSVEALNAVLAFSGSAGGTMVDILGQMEDKAGSTQEAFDKVSESLNQRLIVQLSFFADQALAVGNTILSVIVPALETFTGNLDLVGAALIGLSVTQLPAH
jgi:TP901 family phage tail tape measure protein